MRLSVRQIRLSFPLRLVVDDVMVSTPVLDTMAYCTRLEADVALWPLLRGEVVVHRFGFDGTTVNYADSLAQFGLYARVGHFSLAADRIDLKGSVADISGIELKEEPSGCRSERARRIPRRRLKESRLPGKYG